MQLFWRNGTAKMRRPHCSHDELVVSDTAVRRGIDNTPDAAALKNLKHLAAMLERVGSALGKVPMRVNSADRCDALNTAIESAKSRQPKTGLAVRFTAPTLGTVLQTAQAVAACGIADNPVFSAFNSWVRLGVSAPGAILKGELLSIGDAHIDPPGLKNVA
jgi:zinc D-Ala-D-Ala carboxypeptidase